MYSAAPGRSVAPTVPAVATATVAVPPPAEAAVRLAARLFGTPPRWGWQAVEYPDPEPPAEVSPDSRPEWVDPPEPDTTALRRLRGGAITRLVVTVVVGLVALGLVSAVTAVLPVPAGYLRAGVLVLFGILALRALYRVWVAARRIRDFQRPYRQYLAAERHRYQQARAQWEQAAQQYQAQLAQARTQRASGPLWYPVLPAADPLRVDVLGGDPRRNGWASLLITLGTSALATGQHVTVLDLTGQHVAAGLLEVATARGLDGTLLRLPHDGDRVDLLAGLTPQDIGEALAYAVTGRQDTDERRYERALTTEVVDRVSGCLDAPVSFARLAAGIQVLRQVTPADGLLSAGEIGRLAEQVGEVGRDDLRHLRFVANQLDELDAASTAGARTPFSGTPVSVLATSGETGDDKDLLDRMLVQLALRQPGRYADLLVVAGTDRLGTATTAMLADHTRTAGIRLVLMVDQPQGEMERTAGTGGAVCVMRLYNHKDAAVAADFIGREYRFVVNQFSAQVGKSFSEGGGDTFSAGTNESTSKGGLGQRRSQSAGTSHTLGGSRNWTMGDSLNNSTTTGRVYEFIVDPQQMLALPETAFILVDSSGPSRRVVLADSYPGICLLDRVAPTPRE